MQKLPELLRPLVHTDHQHPIRQRIERPPLANLEPTTMLHQFLDLGLYCGARGGRWVVEERGFGEEGLNVVDYAHGRWARGFFEGHEAGEGKDGEGDGFGHCGEWEVG